MSAVDWGDVPTWIGAFFAAGAATAAIWTLASQRAQIGEQRAFIAIQSANLALERAELQSTAEERKREQARQVTFRARLDDTGIWRAVFGNESREPVTDVSVRMGGEMEFPRALSARYRYDSSDQRTVEAAGDVVQAPLSVVGANGLYVFLLESLPAQRGTLDGPIACFTDSRGTRWRLDTHGDLREVDRR
ncbi:hypothetical protein ACFVGY_18780 [Streptomyces sp. NPDC127106]|uniref:hypothetical protein n=1 Tax=Streptomyces sp. NPDC127106 TaxID=3345360 RepID=UPI003631CA2C